MIYVVRHGQTELNKEGRLQGRRGLPLNEFGIEQAEALRDSLKHIQFDHVFFFSTREGYSNSRNRDRYESYC